MTRPEPSMDVFDKVYVLDTNILLAGLEHLYRLSQEGRNLILVPETVLVELEAKKKDAGELGYQARQFARMIAECEEKMVFRDAYADVVWLIKGEVSIWLVSKNSYKASTELSPSSELNDKRIIETAGWAASFFENMMEVVFVSIDVYARMISRLHNVATQTLHEDKKEVPDFVFYKEIVMPEEEVRLLTDGSPAPVSSNPALRSFFFKSEGAYKAAIAEGDALSLLDEVRDFRGLAVKPVNLRQKLLAKAILSPAYDVCVVDAMAGSGKTLLAIACAMRLVDFSRQGDNHYEGIIYCRNSIESVDRGAEVGFLAGNAEKFRIYNMALQDTMEFIARKKLKSKEAKEDIKNVRAKAEELIERYNIQTLWPGEARGRNLANCVVIMDEWQNASDKTTQLILSRLDNTCKAIIIGSNRQIDNLYLNKYNNGLTSMLKKTQQPNVHLNIFALDLEKSVRGKFAQFADEEF